MNPSPLPIPDQILTINLIQLLLPFIALGDLATDIWFLVSLIIGIAEGEQRDKGAYIGLTVGFGVLMLGNLQLSAKENSRVFAGVEEGERGKRCWPGCLHLLCCYCNMTEFYLFLYQRCSCFGPRNPILETHLSNPAFAIVKNFLLFHFLLVLQLYYYLLLDRSPFSLLNVILTGF